MPSHVDQKRLALEAALLMVERIENLARLLDVTKTFAGDAEGGGNWLSLLRINGDQTDFFAKHPALRSIASISIIGIVCVFIMSQTLEPYLFRWLITNRTKKGFAPMTLVGILRTGFTYGLFVLGALVLTAIGFVFRLVPFGKKKIKMTPLIGETE